MEWFKSAGFLGLALGMGAAGCKSNAPAPIVDVTNGPGASGDPADANIASGVPNSTPQQQPARVLSQRSQLAPQQAGAEQYPQQQAQYPAQQQYLAQQTAPDESQYAQQTGPAYDQAYEQDQAAVDAGQQALFAEQAPPPLPEYEQPELTEPGYEWTPGYWSYAPQGYYWVPGAWVAPPYEGALWTPGYWGYVNSRYQFHHGFWGQHVGFYGGINYGHGYFGQGYRGGYWNGNHFFYNTQVNRVNTTVVRNTYIHNVTIANNNNRISFNGPRGIEARPTGAEIAVYHERIIPAMHVQVERQQVAATNRQQFFTENHGRPGMVAATDRFAADRTPPPAIHITPAVIRGPEQRPVQGGQPGNFVRPGNAPGSVPPGDRGQQAREQQMQNEQRQGQAQQQNVQRQQEQQNALHQEQVQRQQQDIQRQQQNGQKQQQDMQRQQQSGQPQRAQPQPVNRAPQNVRPEAAPTVHPTPAPSSQIRQAPAPAVVAPRPEAAPQPRVAPAPPSRPAPAANPAPAPRPAPAAAPPAQHPTPAQRPSPSAKAPEQREEHPH